jgi:hypothetical protein
MKKSIFFLLLIQPFLLFCQSNPIVLRNDISIQRIMTIRDGAIRMAQDPVSHDIYYVVGNANIYKVIRPTSGSAYDSLVYTVADHGVDYPQCILFKDSTLFICGNESPDNPTTRGIVRCGKLNSSGNRIWRTVMLTAPYATSGAFDHKFSSIVLTPSGDSIVVNSGARGDHGEVQTRGGLYPQLRNVPLTAKLFIIPVNDSTYLQNDSLWLANSGFIYAEGVRNNFSLAYAANGRLFGLENSGDRDHNEEMNWLRKGHHYGFPYYMGDTKNPQQHISYDCSTDHMINHCSIAWRAGAFHNDPQFPPSCVCYAFDEPIQNIGPDCDKFRDTSTYTVKDASDLGITMGTFTAHRSPLGLVFDNDSLLVSDLRGDAFMLSWTKGLDSTGGIATLYDTTIGPFVDPSQDFVHLHMMYNASADKYTLSATTLISSFSNPVDAKMDHEKIYVLENNYTGQGGLYEVTMPQTIMGVSNEKQNRSLQLYPNPASNHLNVVLPVKSYATVRGEILNSKMEVLSIADYKADKEGKIILEVFRLKNGVYFFRCKNEQKEWTGKFIINN